MFPKIITHNSVSLEGSITGFLINQEINHAIIRNLQPDAMLIGSSTAKAGIKLYSDIIPDERPVDFVKPRITSEDNRPYWVIPDNQGLLHGRLHIFRQSAFCKDIIILLSEKSPDSYVKYLLERNYDVIISGHEEVELKKSLEILADKYDCRIVVTDSGGNLNNALLEAGLVDEISLIINPVLVDQHNPKLFRSLLLSTNQIQLELLKVVQLGNQLHVHYKLIK